MNFYRHGAQFGIQGDLLLTVTAITNPCDLPGMRHLYGGDFLKQIELDDVVDNMKKFHIQH